MDYAIDLYCQKCNNKWSLLLNDNKCLEISGTFISLIDSDYVKTIGAPLKKVVYCPKCKLPEGIVATDRVLKD